MQNNDLQTQTTTSASMDTKPIVICCGVVEKMLIAWMIMEDGTKVMPFIPSDDGNKYRVNYCPSCGAYVRDATIKP